MNVNTTKTKTKKQKDYFDFCLKDACSGCIHSKLRKDSDTGIECTKGLLRVCKPFTERNYYTALFTTSKS